LRLLLVAVPHTGKAFGLLVLAGCVAARPEHRVRYIDALINERGAVSTGWAAGSADDEAIRAWVAEPMSAASAVRMAMVRSPRMQQEYARLGLARADVLDAMQSSNPHVSVSYLTPLEGDGNRLSLAVGMEIADLVLLPARLRLAVVDRRRAERQIGAAILGVMADVESSWFRAAAAAQIADLRLVVADGMAASAELARRYYEAGNLSELQLNQERAAATEARIAATRAGVDALVARLDLNLAIGLTGPDATWAMEPVLPLPVVEEDDPAMLAEMARVGNLSLLAARQELAILEDAAGIVRTFRWLGDTEIGIERESEINGSVLLGPTADVEVPLFNQGQAQNVRAQAELAGAHAQLAELELASDNGVRLGAERVRMWSEIVTLYREALIPQRQTVTARSQEEQNYMLIGVFELIRAKTQEIDAQERYLEALREYWLARVDLGRLVGARLPSDARIEVQPPAAIPPVPGAQP